MITNNEFHKTQFLKAKIELIIVATLLKILVRTKCYVHILDFINTRQALLLLFIEAL